MSDYRTATGFAARVRQQAAPPPPRPPAPDDTLDIDLTVTETDAPAELTPEPPTQRRRPARRVSSPTQDTAPPSERPPERPSSKDTGSDVAAVDETDRVAGERPIRGARPVSLQLEGHHISFIRDGARARRLFVNVWLRRLLTEEADRVAGGEPIPEPPSAQGPDDFVFYRQFSARLHPETIERLDSLADEHAEGNRSHLVRVLLDRGEQRYRSTDSAAAT
jgi:hypothetical protein